jgi:hypothetical protein
MFMIGPNVPVILPSFTRTEDIICDEYEKYSRTRTGTRSRIRSFFEITRFPGKTKEKMNNDPIPPIAPTKAVRPQNKVSVMSVM